MALGFFIVAGLMQAPVRETLNKSELITPEAQKIIETDPQLALVKAIPGGLRAIGLNYFWFRSRLFHDEGRHFDAYDLAKVICTLQPHRAEVWDFQAWNMAWNISVKCKSKQQRWRWIYNGIKLLRDKGIPHNPNEGKLYKSLSWIFQNKFADEVDEMHLSYKQRWASKMHRVLGAPIHDVSLTSFDLKKSPEYIQMSDIASGLIDRNPKLQGDQLVQTSQVEIMLKRPHVKKYIDRLKPYEIRLDQSFLFAYNRISISPSETFAWFTPYTPTVKQTDAPAEILNDRQLFVAWNSVGLYDILNDKEPDAVKARKEILAFIRAQVLWNRYRLDPKRMVQIMEKFDAPLDWRHAAAHALYWSEQGDEVMEKKGVKSTAFSRLNNTRFMIFALKDLMYRGKVSVKFVNRTPLFRVPPSIMNYPDYQATMDLRIIKPLFKFYKKSIDQLYADTKTNELKQDSKLNDSFKNFLHDAMLFLVADGQIAYANKLFTYYKKNLLYEDEIKIVAKYSVEDYVKREFINVGSLRSETVIPVIDIAIKRAILAKALKNDQKEYKKFYDIAKQYYQVYQKQALDRYKIRSKLSTGNDKAFQLLFMKAIYQMIMRPNVMGLQLNMDQRSDIYLAFINETEMICQIYAQIVSTELRGRGKSEPCQLRLMCNLHKVDFDKAFPMPKGFKEFIAEFNRKIIERNQNSK